MDGLNRMQTAAREVLMEISFSMKYNASAKELGILCKDQAHAIEVTQALRAISPTNHLEISIGDDNKVTVRPVNDRMFSFDSVGILVKYMSTKLGITVPDAQSLGAARSA